MKQSLIIVILLVLPIQLMALTRECLPEAILEDRCLQKPEQQKQSILEKKKQKRVVAVGEFKQGEGCLAGFRRLGYTVTVAQCQKAAKESSLSVLFAESSKNTAQADILIVDIHPGEPFAVLEAEGNKATKIKLYKRPKYRL